MKKSALFIDFDNAYLCLKDLDAQQAESFATKPRDWIRTLLQDRKVLVRRCYLNPASFGKYRPFFIAAGFDVIDCPPVTNQGKTAADMHMLMDILDKLQHPTHFDEFILFSGDTDFAPVLKRLRENDRETSIVHFGPISGAYRAAADNILPFAFSNQPESPAAGPQAETVQSPREQQQTPLVIQLPPQGKPLSRDKNEAIKKFIVGELSDSSAPIACNILITRLQTHFGDEADGWFGRGKMTDLFDELSLGDQGVGFDPAPPGRVYLEGVHTLDEPDDWTSFEEDSEITALARRVCDLTNTPNLSGAQFAKCFGFLSDELHAQSFQGLSQLSKQLRDFAVDNEIAFSRIRANNMLFMLQHNGISLEQGYSAAEIADAYYRGVLFECSRNQCPLNETDRKTLKRWLCKQAA